MKWLAFFFLGIPILVFGQEKNKDGFPFIKNYTPQEYDSHVQSWEFSQDSSGVIYVANNNSLLRFDGKNWKDISFPGFGVNSVQSDIKGKIYIGGRNEFGYLAKPLIDTINTVQYYSLKKHLPDSIDVGRINAIRVIDKNVFFHSSYYLLKYDGNSVQVVRPEKRIFDMFVRDDRLFISDGNVGLKELKGTQLTTAKWADDLKGTYIYAYAKLPRKEIYCTWNKCYDYLSGEFSEFKTEADDYFASKYIDEVIALRDGTLLFGTRQGGIVNVDSTGKLLHILDEERGLINNTVYDIFEDQVGAVWVATRNGISKVEYSLPLRRYDRRVGINEMPMTVTHFNENYFVTVNTGVIYKNIREGFFKKLQIGEGCNEYSIINSNLYIVCGSYTYKVSESGSKLKFYGSLKDNIKHSNTIMYYSGNNLGVAKQVGNSFIKKDSLEFNIEGVIHVRDDEFKNIWVSTRTNGIFKVKYNDQEGHKKLEFLRQYLKNSRQDNKSIYLSTIQDDIVFLNYGKGVLRYNPQKDDFEAVTEYGDFLTDTTRQYFKIEEDPDGDLWIRSGQAYQGLLKNEEGKYELYEGVLNRIDDRQSNDIYPDPYGYIWYATDKGLVRYTKDHNFDHAAPYYVGINEVLVRNDSLINGGLNRKKDVLKYADNELRFTYAAASYDDPEKTQYRVKLENFDEDWSAWTSETQKDYTNIPEGDYSFSVQARNVYGTVSESVSFEFSVLPPWYRSWWAYFLYVVFSGVFLYMVYRIRVNQLLKVHRMRDRIASDLHDEVSATLSSISYFAQAIEDDRLKNKGRFVKLIHDSAGDAKEKITDIVWAINPENDDWSSFLSKCRRYASDLLESKNIKYSLKIDEHIPGKLDMELRQNLWMIFKEMLTNAVRHSEADQLDVILTHSANGIQLVVQDNGTGMEEEIVKKGNGLNNIRKRANKIAADITLDSDKGFGTRWTLIAPL